MITAELIAIIAVGIALVGLYIGNYIANSLRLKSESVERCTHPLPSQSFVAATCLSSLSVAFPLLRIAMSSWAAYSVWHPRFPLG